MSDAEDRRRAREAELKRVRAAALRENLKRRRAQMSARRPAATKPAEQHKGEPAKDDF